MSIDPTKMIQPVQKALGPVGASLSEAWAAVIGDKITAWRLTNAAKLQPMVNSEIAKYGVKLDRSKIPERYAFAWFEEATKQDEPEILELFARLLAKAAAGDEDAADRRHLETLTHFTPMDAKVFEIMFAQFAKRKSWGSWSEYEIWKELREQLGDNSERSVEHLINLGVVERTYSITQDGSFSRWDVIESGMRTDCLMDKLKDSLSIDSELNATMLGMSLSKACSPTFDEPETEKE